MEIKLIKKDDQEKKAVFLIKNSTPGFVNAIRRTIIESVPVMAIEDVEIKQNSSILYDEMLALRLGLIPLKSDLTSYNVTKNCTCKGEGCAKCSVSLSLSAKGPITVYASDLKSKDPAITPVYPNMPIVTLLKGQEIELNAIATLGLGRDHAKWCPAFVHYTYEPKLKINNSNPKLNEFKNKYPPQVFEDGKISERKILDLGLVDACEGINDEIVKVEYNENNFIFTIESFGQLKIEEIFKRASEILKEESEEFTKEIEK